MGASPSRRRCSASTATPSVPRSGSSASRRSSTDIGGGSSTPSPGDRRARIGHSHLVHGVYPIIDIGGAVPEARAIGALEQALAGGARWIQLRAKALAARELLALGKACADRCHAAGARLVIKDRPDIALLAGADGVHLGQTDLPADAVR